MSDSQSDTSRPSPEQPSSLSGNRGDRRGPLNRALIREKKSGRNESSAERDFKDTDGEYINRQSTHEPLSLAEKITRELQRGEKLSE